jgi:hypothetical protein
MPGYCPVGEFEGKIEQLAGSYQQDLKRFRSPARCYSIWIGMKTVRWLIRKEQGRHKCRPFIQMKSGEK